MKAHSKKSMLYVFLADERENVNLELYVFDCVAVG